MRFLEKWNIENGKGVGYGGAPWMKY